MGTELRPLSVDLDDAQPGLDIQYDAILQVRWPHHFLAVSGWRQGCNPVVCLAAYKASNLTHFFVR
jgi:hypothetical protein